MPRVINILSFKAMITLLHNVLLGTSKSKKVDDDEIETVVYEPTSSVTDSYDDVRIFSIQLGVIRYSDINVSNENWRRSSVFHTYITHEGNNYKLMIDVVV